MLIYLDRSSQSARRSRIEYFGATNADGYGHLTWQGYFDNFCEGHKVDYIARLAHQSPSAVLRVYERWFRKEIFFDREYEAVRNLVCHDNLTRQFPNDPVVRFFVDCALANGHLVTPTTRCGNAGKVHKRHLLFDDQRCSLHTFGPNSDREINLETLARDQIEVVGIVLRNPDPTHGIVVPHDVLKTEPRIRDGSCVRFYQDRAYPRAVPLPARMAA